MRPLVVHNGLQVYHLVTMIATLTPPAEASLLAAKLLQPGALGMLA